MKLRLGASALMTLTWGAAGEGSEIARLYGNINKYAYYFTEILVGSPDPQRVSVIIDTGSRLLGFPCRGCAHCGQHIDPAFDFAQSKTARWLTCGMSCFDTCSADGDQCQYEETYSEGSSIRGRWFKDQVKLGATATSSADQNPAVEASIGCHNNENKLFYTQKANGIMGLAPAQGQPATVLQDLFRDRAEIKTSMFSICLADWGGELVVGSTSKDHHTGPLVWTPLRAVEYYYITPQGFDLLPTGGGDAVEVTGSSAEADFGATIVDSGTTYSYFPGTIYNAILKHLIAYCGANECGAEKEADGTEDCWRLKNGFNSQSHFPTLRMHLSGGAKVEWLPDSYLQENGEVGRYCHTFRENNMFQTVLGISWMIHKDVVFDIENSRMGLAAATCPEHHRVSDYMNKAEVYREVAHERIHSFVDPASKAAPQAAAGQDQGEAARNGLEQVSHHLVSVLVAFVALTTLFLSVGFYRQRRSAGTCHVETGRCESRNHGESGALLDSTKTEEWDMSA